MALTEEVIRHRFQLLARGAGVPEAKNIGQDEIVSTPVLEALDTAGHDVEVFVRNLAGKEDNEAAAAFTTFREGLQTKALREMSEQTFQTRFLRGL